MPEGMPSDKIDRQELSMLEKHMSGEIVFTQAGDSLLKGQVATLIAYVVRNIREKFDLNEKDRDEVVRFLGGLVTDAKDTLSDGDLRQRISANELAYRFKILNHELQIDNSANPPKPNTMMKALALAKTSIGLSYIQGEFGDHFKAALSENGFGRAGI